MNIDNIIYMIKDNSKSINYINYSINYRTLAKIILCII